MQYKSIDLHCGVFTSCGNADDVDVTDYADDGQ